MKIDYSYFIGDDEGKATQSGTFDISDQEYQEFKQYFINLWNEENDEFENDTSNMEVIEDFLYQNIQYNDEIQSISERVDGDHDYSIEISNDEIYIYLESFIKGGYIDIRIKGYNQ